MSVLQLLFGLEHGEGRGEWERGGQCSGRRQKWRGKEFVWLQSAQPHKESLWLAVRFLLLTLSKGQKPLLGEENLSLQQLCIISSLMTHSTLPSASSSVTPFGAGEVGTGKRSSCLAANGGLVVPVLDSSLGRFQWECGLVNLAEHR